MIIPWYYQVNLVQLIEKMWCYIQWLCNVCEQPCNKLKLNYTTFPTSDIICLIISHTHNWYLLYISHYTLVQLGEGTWRHNHWLRNVGKQPTTTIARVNTLVPPTLITFLVGRRIYWWNKFFSAQFLWTGDCLKTKLRFHPMEEGSQTCSVWTHFLFDI